MNKLFKILSLFVFSFCMLIFSSCKINLNETLSLSLSEVRYNLFSASNEKVNVKFTSGFREDPYVLNGKSENKKEFGILVVKFLTETPPSSALPSFVISINSMDFDGDFELNPFDQTYVQDIETFVLDDSKIVVKIVFGDFIYESELKSISNSFNINHKQALNIFTKQFQVKIEDYIKNNISFEIYVKIIDDPSLQIDKNYFYVALITNTGENLSVIIDPMSSKILAKNENKNSLIL